MQAFYTWFLKFCFALNSYKMKQMEEEYEENSGILHAGM